MSMAVLSPIFPYLSSLCGFFTGVMAAVGVIIVLASLRYRDFPTHLVQRGIVILAVMAAGGIFSFSLFRATFGIAPFNLLDSVGHVVTELFIRRANFFLLGAAIGLLVTLAVFFGSITRAVRQKYGSVFGHGSALRGLMASWQ